MIKILNEILTSFRENFTRGASFQWFIAIVLGFMLRTDKLGVTSVIRDFRLSPKSYPCIIHFFRSSSWDLNELRLKWLKCTKEHAPIYTCEGRTVIIGDGVKQSKEARKMPGVKKLHQESENSSKAEYIFGHLHGGVGVLAGNSEKLYCLPISLKLHDGIHPIRSLANDKDCSQSTDSHVVQMIKDGYESTKVYGDSLMLLDRYFLSGPALETLNELNASNAATLDLVVKAKMSCLAYEKPPIITEKRRGRPPKKGATKKLKKLFECPNTKFQKASLNLYGKVTEVEYCCLNLLWGQGRYQELRFVLVNYQGTPSILATTLLDLDPLKVIELYAHRFKIECTFRELKQVIGGFSYQFWSKSMPKLNRYKKKTDPDPLASIKSPKEREKIIKTIRALEVYMLISSIALGLLQILALKSYKSPKLNLFTRYLRTRSNKVPSEATIAQSLRIEFFQCLAKNKHMGITKIILSKQDKSSSYKDELVS